MRIGFEAGQPARVKGTLFLACLIGLWLPDAAAPRAFPTAQGFSYDSYAALLKANVNDRGLVRYRQLKADGRLLTSFAAQLERLEPETYNGWSDRQKIAFWINAYNALTLEAIVTNYPIQASWTGLILYPKNSIRQISGVWDELTFPVMGQKMSLNHIEHEILRKRFREPRIHLALVCAAIGCPPLRNEPYESGRLDKQLDDQARTFMADPGKFRIDRGQRVVYLSPIFKWYGEDFIGVYASETIAGLNPSESAVLVYLSRFLDSADRKYLAAGQYKIEYLDYDWSLNEQN